MHLVVGLGNPGREYAQTRHNLGFRVCDRLCEILPCSFDREKFASLSAEATAAHGKVMLLKPQTFMNLSGQAVAAAARFYRLEMEDLLVVCDDFNLELGQLRLRRDGSHGGHNGLRHIIERLGDEGFPRLRLGTGPLGDADPVGFCLTRFAPADGPQVDRMIDTAAEAVSAWLTRGIDEAMNQFNVRMSPDR